MFVWITWERVSKERKRKRKRRSLFVTRDVGETISGEIVEKGADLLGGHNSRDEHLSVATDGHELRRGQRKHHVGAAGLSGLKPKVHTRSCRDRLDMVPPVRRQEQLFIQINHANPSATIQIKIRKKKKKKKGEGQTMSPGLRMHSTPAASVKRGKFSRSGSYGLT